MCDSLSRALTTKIVTARWRQWGASRDDGIATGATTRAALRATRLRNPKELVLAVPVAPTEALAALGEEADHVVCLEDYESFGAIGLYYFDFRQISDQEVIETLGRFPAVAYSD